MEYNVYILYSSNLNKFYTGISKFSKKRERQHNKGQTYWTSRANDWQEVWNTEVPALQDAKHLEKKIKKRGAKRFLIDNGVAIPPKAG